MTTYITSFAQMKAVIEQKTIESMHKGKNVKNFAVETVKTHVQEDVYDTYDPYVYERTGELKEATKTENVDNGLVVLNDRKDGNRNVALIVESGQGYEYDSPINGTPRPFMQNSYNELKNSNSLVDAMKRDLRQNGMKVK